MICIISMTALYFPRTPVLRLNRSSCSFTHLRNPFFAAGLKADSMVLLRHSTKPFRSDSVKTPSKHLPEMNATSRISTRPSRPCSGPQFFACHRIIFMRARTALYLGGATASSTTASENMESS